MTDARWNDVEDDIGRAAGHFRMAARLFDAGGFLKDPKDAFPDALDIEAYKAKMAVLHAVQSGHTSLEAALKRILSILGEDAPSGESSHFDLLKRAAKPITDAGLERPEILDGEVFEDADETRRFRHRAAHDYDNFDPAKATTAIDACRRLSTTLKPCIDRFREAVDPRPPGPKKT